MVRRYRSKISHVPCDIIQCHIALMWHWIMSHKSIMHHCKSHAFIGWGAAVYVASHSWLHVITSWRNYCTAMCQQNVSSVPVECKSLILFNRILVSDVTKQMMHDGLVWHANIYVLQLKCQHLGYALVLTFQLRDIYILLHFVGQLLLHALLSSHVMTNKDDDTGWAKKVSPYWSINKSQ